MKISSIRVTINYQEHFNFKKLILNNKTDTMRFSKTISTSNF